MMMRAVMALVGVMLAFGGSATGTETTDLEARNRALKAELKELEAKAVELENAAMRTEESIRISTVAKELMEGTRKEPPRPRTVETLIFEDGVAEPVFFDATAGKVKNKDVWLTEKMKPGSRYRFECEVKTEDLKGTDRVKFGAYLPVKGAPTEWPGVGQTGDGTYGWTKIQFSCTLPHGGSFMLGYGPNNGTGKVWFRNIRGYEVTEVEE